MAIRIQTRRGTAAEWTAANPVLAVGEPGYETNTGNVKYGDGVTTWNALAYSVLAPGPGEVVVGGLSGPVAVPHRPRLGPYVAAIGDSLTAANGDLSSQQPGSGWAGLAPVLSGGRLRMVVRAATSGHRTEQMLDRIGDVFAASPMPSACFVLGGTNDVGQGVAEATTRANLMAIYDALLGRNILPILMTIPPKTGSAAAVSRLNAWIVETAARRGFPVVDLHRVLVNPATGAMQGVYDSGDGTHFSAAGAKAAAQAVVDQIGNLLPPRVALTGQAGAAANLLANGVFLGDANSDGIADSWSWNSTGGAVTTNLVAGTGGVLGNWQAVTVTAAGLREFRHALITTGFAAGDLLQFSGRVQIPASTAMKWTARLMYNDGATKQLLSPLYQATATIEDGVFTATGIVPSGTTLLIPSFVTSDGTGEWRIAQVTLLNLTALGLGGAE